MADTRSHTRMWIPVSERLPEFWEPVLGRLIPSSGNTDVIPAFVYAVTLEDVANRKWIYTGTGGYRPDGGYAPVEGYVVTHWMPYPSALLTDEDVSK